MAAAAQTLAAILGAIVLLGAATAAIAQLWRYAAFRWALGPFVGAARAVWAAHVEARDARLTARIRASIAEELDSRPITNGKGIATLTTVAAHIDTITAQVDTLSDRTKRLERLEGLVARELRLQRLEIKAHRAALAVLTGVDTSELDAQLDAIEAALDETDADMTTDPGDQP